MLAIWVRLSTDNSWRHHITTTIPLPPFLLSSTPRPSHPFLTAIIISQSQRAASDIAVQAINEGIGRTLAGDVSISAMTGFLILALDRPSTLLPSSVRLIALARDVGESLGLEAREEVELKRGEDLLSPSWESTLEDLLLVRCRPEAPLMPVGIRKDLLQPHPPILYPSQRPRLVIHHPFRQ